MSNDDNISQFPTAAGLPENPLQIAPRPPGWCSHESVILDEHARTVQCVGCRAMLEPFSFLQSNARTIADAWRRHREVMRQAGEIADRVHILKKEEARLRAMVKRLQAKVGVINMRGVEPL